MWNRRSKNYSEYEDNIVYGYYPYLKKEFLLKKLCGRTWYSIKDRAKKLNVRRIGRPDTRCADLKQLLKEDVKSYYWMGFIAADGYFSQNRYLGLTLAGEDLKHLRKYVFFIKGDKQKIRKTKLGLFECISGDDVTVPLIKKKFGLLENKTKNPPPLKVFKCMTDENFLSFVVGYIDGDGSIVRQTGRKDCYISVASHESWFEIVKYFEIRIYKIFNYSLKRSSNLTKISIVKATFGTCRMASLRFSDAFIVNCLNSFRHDFKLPVLKRKWSKIP